MDYRFKGAEEDDDFTTIYSTAPAQPGTYFCYAHKDGEAWRDPVVAWGFLCNGTPVPITMDGPEGGTDQSNTYVLFPDGKCGKFERGWKTEAEAIAELGPLEP